MQLPLALDAPQGFGAKRRPRRTPTSHARRGSSRRALAPRRLRGRRIASGRSDEEDVTTSDCPAPCNIEERAMPGPDAEVDLCR